MSSSSSPYPEFSSSPESAQDDTPQPVPDPAYDASMPPPVPGLTNAGPVPIQSHSHPYVSRQEPDSFDTATDGLTDRFFRPKSKGPIAAIFIHAGAGYHSTVNEHVHLEACSDAARIAMRFLKAGGTAVDAVEAAIKCLEDKEITNAGFGSNLSIDGVVEGDATIVDHLGRSGACGSVQLVKNPISLARLIYDKSNVPLTLRRIPPNILVGHGAARFGQEHGMELVPHQHLISRGAYERYCKWRHDLIVADQALRNRHQAVAAASAASVAAAATAAVSAAAPVVATSVAVATLTTASAESAGAAEAEEAEEAHASTKRSRPPLSNTMPTSKRIRLGESDLLGGGEASVRRRQQHSSGDGTAFGEPSRSSILRDTVQKNLFTEVGLHDNDTDIISDTVGAIAIDLRGNIACGSSSGGIGMKHSGRIGPAALVGIGSAVLPADPKDSSGTCVAAVTSGTGEHMATSMASHTCCERLYHGQRRADGGSFEAEYDDDQIMKSFVADDFMNHPGVKNQVSGGAIGILAAKKTTKGIYFYFAHNTDSFALASMSSNDAEPSVVLSRLGPRESVARGGRKIKPN